jgi:hypothetical protein
MEAARRRFYDCRQRPPFRFHRAREQTRMRHVFILKDRRVEKLVLIDKDEKLIAFVRPGDCVLPAGQYEIRQIDVEGVAKNLT